MWIDRKTYDDTRITNAKLQEETKQLTQRNAALETTVEWMRVRISQLELERQQMIYQYMGVKVSVPTIERQAPSQVAEVLNAMPDYNDVGDKMAEALGISWNEAGELVYKDRK